MKKTIEVAAAVIRRDGRVLLSTRPEDKPPAGREFPGGKLEPGETLKQAAERELREELGVGVVALDELFRSDSLQRACLLEQDGETAGYGLLSLKYSHEAGGLELWVEELYVRPAFRGHGLGHEFFAWLRGLSAAEHIRRIRLETEPENERAAALYARMGFSPLGYCQMFREEAT